MALGMSASSFPLVVVASILVLGLGFQSVEGFMQEILFHFPGGELHFTSNQESLEIYSSILPLVTRVCARGRWKAFNEASFAEGSAYSYHGSLSSSELVCNTSAISVSTIKSIRHYGANDSSTDAISLYSGDIYRGTEILVTGPAYAGILIPIVSLTTTGTSEWKLFEGIHLEGKSVCFSKKLEENFGYDYDVRAHLGLATIGSVFKGCSIVDIQKYKEENNML